MSPADVLADAGVKAALAKIDALLANATAHSGLPPNAGMIATVVIDQETALTKGYGRRNPFANNDPTPPSGTDLVRIASISKVFTDTLARRTLAERAPEH